MKVFYTKIEFTPVTDNIHNQSCYNGINVCLPAIFSELIVGGNRPYIALCNLNIYNDCQSYPSLYNAETKKTPIMSRVIKEVQVVNRLREIKLLQNSLNQWDFSTIKVFCNHTKTYKHWSCHNPHKPNQHLKSQNHFSQRVLGSTALLWDLIIILIDV